ncbi:MAG TPA: serine/threonine protein kinase, partial [Cyanobacteria bacterium UBA8156]|nr:serine/threonine protein kinase [Cyanobacteria bacterium UBA8156]
MEIYCTRPSCGHLNVFPDLAQGNTLKTAQQKFCVRCGMPLILGGRYLPEKPLARGGFGATYVARDRYTPAMRRCVVKQLQPTGLTPDQMKIAQAMFEREGAVLEDLGRHPNIPDLLAFFPMQAGQEEYFYLVQEFINGLNLQEVMEQHGPLTESDLRDILGTLLPVLQFVHSKGSIHRDIKPANIM